MRSGPTLLAGADINGCDTAAHVGVDLAAAAYSHTVTRGGENVPTVGRRSPENAAGRAASADLLLPDRFAVVIGIRSEEHTLNSSHGYISYAVFCLKKKNIKQYIEP